jgi:hypothetical protein
MPSVLIPCQCCGQMLPQVWNWFVCNRCEFRVCPQCLSQHQGHYGQGYKCSKCQFGMLEQRRRVE